MTASLTAPVLKFGHSSPSTRFRSTSRSCSWPRVEYVVFPFRHAAFLYVDIFPQCSSPGRRFKHLIRFSTSESSPEPFLQPVCPTLDQPSGRVEEDDPQEANQRRVCDAGGRTHLKLGGEGEDGRAVRASLLGSRSARTWYHPSLSHPIWFCAHSSPPLRNGRHELTSVNSFITPSNFLGCAGGARSHIPSQHTPLMRTIAFLVQQRPLRS